MAKFYIIDGNSFLYRAYYALPPLSTSYGLKINAVYGFMRMLFKIINEEKPDYIAVCFDTPVPTFRHVEHPAYKATREKMDDDLKGQFQITKEILEAMKISMFSADGYEADDIISTIVSLLKQKDMLIKIFSNDKDILCLVDGKVSVYNDNKKKTYTPDEVQREFGIHPKMFIDFLSLIGDKIDNIPGISGLGEKTAKQLLNQFETVEHIVDNVYKLPSKLQFLLLQNKETLFKNKKLFTLVNNVEINFNLDSCKLTTPDIRLLRQLFMKYEFHSLLPLIAQYGDVDVAEHKFEIIRAVNNIESLLFRAKDLKAAAIHLTPCDSEITGISISFLDGSNFYVPIGNAPFEADSGIPKPTVVDFLKKLFSMSDVRKVVYDLKSFLYIFEFKPDKSFFDIMLAAYLVNPTRSDYKLQNLIFDYLSITIKDFDHPSLGMDVNRVAKASTTVSASLLKMFSILDDEIKTKAMEKLYYDIEIPLVEVLYEMEKTGIKVDTQFLKEMSDEFQTKMLSIENEIYDTVGLKFNLNSSQQLAFVLFEKLGLPKVKKTKTGYSTDIEVLKTLSEAHPVVKKIIEYRELQKLKSAYIESLLEHIGSDGRIHSKFNQVGTATGRLASHSPNLQTIPIKTELGRKLRRAFIAESGNKLVSADYAQIELRILAHVSGDENLCRAFNNNLDIHSATASEVFNIPYNDVGYEHRRIAKIINFGIIYGISPRGLAEQLHTSVEVADEYIRNYFKKYEGVKNWIDNSLKLAKKRKYVKSMFGRVRPLPDIESKNPQLRSFSERVAINAPIQGTAADIIKIAMINIFKEIKNRNLNGKFLIQIHDELVFEIPISELEEHIKMIKENMENACELNVPLIVDVKTGDNLELME